MTIHFFSQIAHISSFSTMHISMKGNQQFEVGMLKRPQFVLGEEHF